MNINKYTLNHFSWKLSKLNWWRYSQLGRYSFLGAGVLYGSYNQGRLEKVEAKARVIEAAKKEKRDIQLAAEKKRNAEGNISQYMWDPHHVIDVFIISYLLTAEEKALADLSKPTKK